MNAPGYTSLNPNEFNPAVLCMGCTLISCCTTILLPLLGVFPLAFAIWMTSLGNEMMKANVTDYENCYLWQLADTILIYSYLMWVEFALVVITWLLSLTGTCLCCYSAVNSASAMSVQTPTPQSIVQPHLSDNNDNNATEANRVVTATTSMASFQDIRDDPVASMKTVLGGTGGGCVHCIGLFPLSLFALVGIASFVLWLIINAHAWGGCQGSNEAAAWFGQIQGFLILTYVLLGIAPFVCCCLYCCGLRAQNSS